MPLNIPNPQRRPCEFRSVMIRLDSRHLAWVHSRNQPMPASFRRVVHHLLFEVEQRAQRDIQEVAAAASRVQHAHARQPLPECVKRGAGFVHLAAVNEIANLLLRFLPLAAQRLHHHRLNHQQNVIRTRVVRSQPRPLRSVHYTLEQCAEYRRFDVSPVLVHRLHQPL